MPRGGKRKNQTGRPSEYRKPVSINFRCEQDLKDKIDSYLKDTSLFNHRSELISHILSNFFMNFNYQNASKLEFDFVKGLPDSYGYYLFVLANSSIVTGYYNQSGVEGEARIITLYGETKSYCQYVESEVAGYLILGKLSK